MHSANLMTLTAAETRVLGCLMEKQRTTPDTYPLSLNALRLACNQTTNRDPVVAYDEHVIRDALHRLERRGLVRMTSGAGSRATKYRHLLAERLPMDAGEHAVVCTLALRDAQTPGELKQRTERMHAFPALSDVQATLEQLIGRGLVERLPRRPGQKEERYRQLLELREEDGEGAVGVAEPSVAHTPEERMAPSGGDGEVGQLRERVARLEREVAELREAVAIPVGEPGP